MHKLAHYALAVPGLMLSLANTAAVAADPVVLSESSYKDSLGVIITQINWGRTWKCGRYENAQLQALTFTKSPINSPQPVSLELETPSRLFADNEFTPYAYVVQPGEYVLTAFDVKIARSTTDVAHIMGTMESLIKDGKPAGGSFTVSAGEIVYIGHFGLDCGAEPFLWRYYVDGRAEFEKYIDGFRKKFPFLKKAPVQFRLFATQTLGNAFSLTNPAVK